MLTFLLSFLLSVTQTTTTKYQMPDLNEFMKITDVYSDVEVMCSVTLIQARYWNFVSALLIRDYRVYMAQFEANTQHWWDLQEGLKEAYGADDDDMFNEYMDNIASVQNEAETIKQNIIETQDKLQTTINESARLFKIADDVHHCDMLDEERIAESSNLICLRTDYAFCIRP